MSKDKNYSNVNLDFSRDKDLLNTPKKIIDLQINDKASVSHASFSKVRPWVRFYARSIDNFVFGFIFLFFLGYFSPSSVSKSFIVIGIISFLTWMFIESILLASWGATLGKWIFKVKVRDSEGRKLTFLVALHRSFLLSINGLAFGLPIVCLFTQIFSYRNLTKKGITSWDKECHLTVTHQKIGNARIFLLFLIIGLFNLIFIMPLVKNM